MLKPGLYHFCPFANLTLVHTICCASDGGPQLESANTLWSLLMKDERLCEETFIKYIFKGREVNRMEGSKESVNSILYKTRDNDISISSLCLNMVSAIV